MIKVIYRGKEKKYSEGAKYLELARDVQEEYPYDILLAMVNGKLQELAKPMEEGAEVEFLTAESHPGMRAYRRSVELLLLKSIYDVVEADQVENVIVDFSLSKGLFCYLNGAQKVTEEFLVQIDARMRRLVEENLPIEKENLNTDVAIQRFHQHKMYDKECLMRYRRVSRVNLYRINEFEDYYFGYMLPSTGYLKYFQLFAYDDGFVIQFPERKNPTVIPPFEPQNKVYEVMRESSRWGKHRIPTVGRLNDCISNGHMNELILVQEALMEKRLAELADSIAKNPEKKIVMIAGPSSSGKTTFSHRLSIQLMAKGLRPHPISVDNYFLNREFTPKDEFGNYNFEDLEAIDIEQFDRDMVDLLHGKRVQIPNFNFISGKREYKGDYLKLEDGEILVIEGIHCLNDKLSPNLPAENKYKVYISALTQLNVDEHNRIPTTDGRLIRRIVRDARTRGASAKQTIRMWESVRNGEEKNIFPYQETADMVFNSALVYELAVLKQYAEPLLYGIRSEEPEYLEAKRLLKFFDYFLGVSSEDIPKNSILREFIGGSCFKV